MMPELSSSGVPKEVTAILAGYFKDAAGRLKAVVKKPGGGTAAGQAFRQGRAAQQLNQVDAILRGLKQQASGWIGANVPKAYREGRERADKQAEDAGVRVEGSGLSGSFGLIDQRSLMVLAQSSATDAYKAADAMGGQVRDVVRKTAQLGLGEKEINDILAGGMIEGQPRETIKALADAFRGVYGETIPIVDKNGDVINFDAGDYAELVARTRTREAAEKGRHNRLRELGIDLVVVIGKVSNTFCTGFLGKIFSIGGDHPKYPPLSSLPGGGPPFHPRCSKSTRPFIEELAEEEQIADGQVSGDVSKLAAAGDTTKAQRMFKDLQIRNQVEDKYRKSTRPAAVAGAGGGG